jgi:hypothetical protein
MINFYRRFIPGAAKIQGPLYDLLHGPIKGSSPVKIEGDALAAFNNCKKGLCDAALLDAHLALVTDASNTAIGAVLQQRKETEWQPLAFFSKKLNQSQQKNSPYDRELLAIYEAVRYFRHMLEARVFTVFTDHKPITFAFSTSRDGCSLRLYIPIYHRYKTHFW